ncbi:MAG: hypothetical protein KJO79_05945, partial [Verrucomicrobiae bacterium]|nr:hypothetical protein [Verrucomicrobiae bacterium]NNJ86704.1 hypothetical protein [Akkermansiaceae bacterium]
MAGASNAQQMEFDNYSLVSGSDLQTGAAYRFSQVAQDVDAIITVDNLYNASLRNIDSDSSSSIGKEGWIPVLAGTGDASDVHFVDFSIVFYANNTNDMVTLGQLTTT